jgi:pilus assembly protein CpaE
MADKILLVDDDLDTLRLVGLMLQRQGYEIRAASSGPQALAIVEREIPDLILLDVMMPEMDGLEVTGRLRANPSTSSVPIILFTAKNQVDDKILGFESGADDYLIKPAQPRELVAHIKVVLARRAKETAHFPPVRPRGTMIGILAAKGGLGVSTVALNLGVALAGGRKGEVIVADFRPGQGTIGLELGFSKADGVTRLLQRKPNEITPREIEGQIASHTSGVRFLLSSYQPGDARYGNLDAHFETIARHLPYMASFVILDLGPSLSVSTEKVLPHCDEIVVIVEPIPNTLIQSKALIDDVIAIGVGEGRLKVALVNRFRSGVQLSASQVQEKLSCTMTAMITPAPELAYQASLHNIPLIVQQPDSLTAQQIGALAEKLVKNSR